MFYLATIAFKRQITLLSFVTFLFLWFIDIINYFIIHFRLFYKVDEIIHKVFVLNFIIKLCSYIIYSWLKILFPLYVNRMETPAVALPLARVERQLYEQLIGFSNPQQTVCFTRNGNIFSIKLDSSWHQTLWSVKYISELGLFTKREPTRVGKLYGPWEKALFLSCHRLESCECLERQVPLCRPPFKCQKNP